ncbi:hypothetical protein KIPB_012514, partial [Kipferlia bialata]|eukprot:g12514.t1
MIMKMEQTCAEYMEHGLGVQDGYASVGWKVDIVHTAPLLSGDDLDVAVTVADVAGTKVYFDMVAAGLDGTVVGKGLHGRAYIPAPEEAVAKAQGL